MPPALSAEEGVGILNRPRLLPRPTESDPAQQAQRIVATMSEDIVRNLRAAGVAAVGFGAGGSSMNVQVGVSDLANQADAPFIVFGTVSSADHLPGGLATRNPYVVAAKFVMEKHAPDKDIERTAKAITDELLKYRDQIKREAARE